MITRIRGLHSQCFGFIVPRLKLDDGEKVYYVKSYDSFWNLYWHYPSEYAPNLYTQIVRHIDNPSDTIWTGIQLSQNNLMPYKVVDDSAVCDRLLK